MIYISSFHNKILIYQLWLGGLTLLHTHTHTHIHTRTHTQDDGNEAFFTDLAALELINAIRSDHSLFSKYQHSSKLVQVLNSFARTECDLPTGWERKVDRKTGKVSKEDK